MDVGKFIECVKNMVIGRGQLRDTFNFWPLNANSSKTNKVTDLEYENRRKEAQLLALYTQSHNTQYYRETERRTDKRQNSANSSTIG